MSNGEVIEFDKAAAERRAERITLRLDNIADNYAAVMPMIREAIEKRDDIALGYNSPTAYVSDRFGGSLQRLGYEVRVSVVKELTAAGMSVRAISPVVGVSKSQVAKDAQVSSSGHLDSGSQVNIETGEVSDDYVTDQADLDQELPAEDVAPSDDTGTQPSEAVESFPVPAPACSVTGLDGKTYSRPAPSKPRRTPLPDSIRNAVLGAETKLTTLRDLTRDDRWPRNAEEVAPRLRNDLVRLNDLLEQVEKSLPENEVTA